MIGGNLESMRNQGKIVGDRLVEIELPLVPELQQTKRNEGFADRADLEQLIGTHRPRPLHIPEAERRHALNPGPIGQHECHAGSLPVPQVSLDERVEEWMHRPVGFRSPARLGGERGFGHLERCTGQRPPFPHSSEAPSAIPRHVNDPL